jgi:hypothetical protein
MPSGFTVQGTDLDNIFEPRQSGDPTVNATGFVSGDNGLDLNQRYLPITEGEQITSNTGFSNPIGSDFRLVFAALGSANSVPFTGVSTLQTVTIATNQVGEQVVSIASIQFNTNGTTGQVETSSRNSGTVDNNVTNAIWVKDAPEVGIGSEYEISVDSTGLNITTGINPVTIFNPSPAPAYTALSSSAFFSITCEATGGNGGNEAIVEGPVVFNIRKIGTTKVYTKTIIYNVSAIPI